MTITKLSETVLLPKTDFAMRGEMAKREPLRLKAWLDGNLYRRIRDARKGAPAFYLHDGPPYANGNIHIGHALNKILKDIVVRYKNIRGFDAPYMPGWDCHGLPIELKAIEKSGATGQGAERKLAVRKACRAYADKYLAIQRDEFQRLGILGEFEQPYVTMDPNYQADILEGLATLVERGYIVHAEKPVLWCPHCRTALADAEVEYEESKTPAITVKFAVEGQPGTFILIWTTTPWTLPGNLAVAVNPEAVYLRAKVGAETWIVAESRAADAGVPADASSSRLPGRELVGLRYRHPFMDRTGQAYPADFVTLDTGTGVVHIAPGHGEEDFQLGQKHGLPVFSPVDAAGRLTKDAGEFSGQFVFDANPKVIERLKQSGALVRSDEMMHTYPHCWRCKHPVIFRATPQWFIDVDHENLRGRALEAIGGVRWVPAVGEKRIRGMVESRPDWCISRQRAWGVPIPAVHCASCGKAFLLPDVVRRVAAQVREKTADVWFAEPPETFLPKDWSCPSCGEWSTKREEDILDVWFDSGMSHIAAFERRYKAWPSDLYLEGSDQHRGWFQVSLLLGLALKGASPYRQVLTHGFVMDGEGRKMSKSMGNVVTPQEIVAQHGSDVLRLWTAGCDYSGDVRLGKTIVTETVDTYRRIRNTIRFLLGNLHGFDPSRRMAPAELDERDRYLLMRLSDLVSSGLSSYEAYDFSGVSRKIRDFCAEEMSGFYLDILKDTLYCDAADLPARRSAQTALSIVADQLLMLVSPILPFTADEAWEAWGHACGDISIARIEPWSAPPDDAIRAKFGRMLETRREVNAAIEKIRQEGRIGGSLEASIIVRTSGEEWDALSSMSGRLAEYFIVSSCVVEQAEKKEILIDRSPGEKCGRCWKYVPSRIPALDGAVCPRCAGVLRTLGIPG